MTWIERMNADMLAAGVELGDRHEFDVVHGHDGSWPRRAIT